MKAQLALLGLLLPTLLTAAEFKEFTSKEGKFTVLLPGTPKEKKQSFKDGARTIDLYQFNVELEGRTYQVAYHVDDNLTRIDADLIQKTYDGIRDSGVKALKGKLIADKKATVADYPGREFQIDVPKVGVYRSRIVVVGDRLYQVSLLGPKDVVLAKESDKYLDSLKVNQ